MTLTLSRREQFGFVGEDTVMEDPGNTWSLWSNLGAILVWGATIVIAWLIRQRDLVKLGKNVEDTNRTHSRAEQDTVDLKLNDARRELMLNQERLLTVANEERASMRERIAVLEASLSTFKDQYDKMVRDKYELQQEVRGLVAQVSRLQTEKHNLERRLAGALTKNRGNSEDVETEHQEHQEDEEGKDQ